MGDISNIKHRQAVTKLRISSHGVPVESGRYNNIPFDKRYRATRQSLASVAKFGEVDTVPKTNTSQQFQKI